MVVKTKKDSRGRYYCQIYETNEKGHRYGEVVGWGANELEAEMNALNLRANILREQLEVESAVMVTNLY